MCKIGNIGNHNTKINVSTYLPQFQNLDNQNRAIFDFYFERWFKILICVNFLGQFFKISTFENRSENFGITPLKLRTLRSSLKVPL